MSESWRILEDLWGFVSFVSFSVFSLTSSTTMFSFISGLSVGSICEVVIFFSIVLVGEFGFEFAASSLEEAEFDKDF